MFTGIIESLGEILSITATGSNRTFWISSPISNDLQVDQSVAHNGVCLTVEEVENGKHQVTAIAETLAKSNLQNWQTGDTINLERSLTLNARLDGHIVQGHVDTTAICLNRKTENGSYEFCFSFGEKFAALIIEKGSVCVNGISLTAFNVTTNQFSVAIIPYTFQHTNINTINKGSIVNIEFDILGKYVLRLNELK